MICEYVSEYYGVPACIGRRVIACGEPGVIAEDRGHYIGVLLDKDQPGAIRNYHPTYQIEYLDMGEVRRLSKRKAESKARYARYREFRECFDSFRHFLASDMAASKGEQPCN